MRDHPQVVLTQHFFRSLFDVGFLSDDGAESLKRALLGSLAVVLALGLLLTRVFKDKYAALLAGSAQEYAQAVVADHMFLIAIPMWSVACAASLIGHALFPDQTDFRILMAEPLSRLSIFASKLASVLLFVGLVGAGMHLAVSPLTALTLMGAMNTGTVFITAAAFAVSSLSASLFAALAVIAIHGLLVLFAPRTRVLAISGAVRSLLIGALVLSFPLIAQLPATAPAFASDASWLRWAPPAWFVGLEQWLIGNTRHTALASQAAIATLSVLVVSLGSYVLLFRRFDRVMFQPPLSGSERGWSRSLHRWVGRSAVQHAILHFVSLTIRRSILHQGLVVGLLAVAGGFVLNSLLRASGWNEPLDLHKRSPLVLTLLWAPMTMMILAIPAIRLALSVPLDPRSNWVFRMTEDEGGRAEIAAANVRVVLALGVALPVALMAPVQWWVLGSRTVGIAIVELLIGWLVVEHVMADWRRIPFTCSYIPGKGFAPLTFVKGFASFLVFTFATMLLLRAALALPLFGVIVAAIVAAVAGALARQRTRHAPHTPMLFDDELPTEITPFRLNAD